MSTKSFQKRKSDSEQDRVEKYQKSSELRLVSAAYHFKKSTTLSLA